jgi:ATP-dependent protease ClpP protease subunit
VADHKFSVTAQRTGKKVRLNLSGYINTDSERVSSAAVNDALDQLEAGDLLEVHIRNLYGGSVPEGLTIFHDIAQYTPDMVIDGVAASMGAVIALAGPVRKMSKHSRLMLHRVSIGASGDPDQVKERANQAQKWEDELTGIIANAIGGTPEDVRAKYMVTGKDHWLSADEAKKAGFVHEVISGSMRKLISTSELENKNAEEILNAFDAAQAPEPRNERTTNPIMKLFGGKKSSAMEALKDVKAEDLTPEQLTAATDEIGALGIKAYLVPVTDEVKNASELQAAMDTMEANLATAQDNLKKATTNAADLDKKHKQALVQITTLKAELKKLGREVPDNGQADTPPEGKDAEAPGDESPVNAEKKKLQSAVETLPHNQMAKRLIGQE